MMLDSPSAMTSQECRYLWEILKLTYADIEPYDLDALQGYIALECAESCRKGKTPRYTIPRRKNDSLCYKMNPDGGIAKAYLKIDCPGQWNGREAVSFSSDGFIGFCGWADSQNSQPFYRAWREWCCRYMAYRYEDGRLVEIVDGLEMLSTDDGNRIRGSYGDAVVVDPAELIDLAEYLESITSVVYWEGKSICGTGNDVSKRLREIVSQSRPC